jgi:6-phosphogluconate dehydrogenase
VVGLRRMGANMVRRRLSGGHRCVVYDRSPGVVQEPGKAGAVGAASLDELAEKLTRPRSA